MLSYLIFLASIAVSLACMPIRVHYQTSFCNAKVAAVINVTSVVATSQEHTRFLHYEGTLIEVFKGLNLTVGSRILLRSVGRFFSCRPTNLQPGTAYVILGSIQEEGIIEVTLYNGAVIITDKDEENAVRTRINSYDCRCKVQNFIPWLPNRFLTPQPNECSVPSVYGCVWKEGVCVYANGGCSYQHSCDAKPV